MSKNIIIWLVVLTVSVLLAGIYVWKSDVLTLTTSNILPTPDAQALLNISSPPIPAPRPDIKKVLVPLPSSDGKTTFIGETVPWSLLLTDASCELKGELKFLNHNTYDNQDALFIYKGIDHPGRNIFWTTIPQDNILVGPNIFNKTSIPDGESLLGVILPDNPQYKKYELTAKIQYGRQVDEKGNFVTEGGNVKLFEKQCSGKTIVVLPQ